MNLSDSRRDFMKKTALATAGASLLPFSSFSEVKRKNKLPAWKGFNLLDFFSHNPDQGRPTKPDYLNWIADWGFDFVRIPISYPSYLNIDRTRPIRPDEVLNFDESRLEKVDQLVEQSIKKRTSCQSESSSRTGFLHQCGF
ncbi:cellulase family glycosylhydrolase [Algoriphagus boritolerans]|uniref:cellulase family glycosylhydrolase n=1 Tax=Algoriphagus boritolerans TaxID=308111 RepID=UPI000A606C39